MSNIIHLNIPFHQQTPQQKQTALMHCFAECRRSGDDVFWLKENAELLNILECSAATFDPESLATYRGFYARVEDRLQFFPQYYRFLLSICLDLEDLGMSGNKGAALVDWVAGQGLAKAELSDLQRMEARRLMLRRGVDPLTFDAGLEDRMRRFIARSTTFSMPNKKAAYELTHAVFYLSEYGRKDPRLDGDTRTSLEFTGLLAFLDQNADLLAEVVIALHYAGFDIPEAWENWLNQHTHQYVVETDAQAFGQDTYHEFLVCNWMMAVRGHEPFAKPVFQDRMAFRRPQTGAGPLRELSECMFRLHHRSGDWDKMRPVVLNQLSENARNILAWAEASSDRFSAFFHGFARASRVVP